MHLLPACGPFSKLFLLLTIPFFFKVNTEKEEEGEEKREGLDEEKEKGGRVREGMDGDRREKGEGLDRKKEEECIILAKHMNTTNNNFVDRR